MSDDPRDETQEAIKNLTRSIKRRTGQDPSDEDTQRIVREPGLLSTRTVQAALAGVIMVVLDRVAVAYGVDVGVDVRASVAALVLALVTMAMRRSQLKIQRRLSLIVMALVLSGCCGHGKLIEAVGQSLNGATGDAIHKALDKDEELTEDRRTDIKINLWLLAESVEKAGGPENTREQPE